MRSRQAVTWSAIALATMGVAQSEPDARLSRVWEPANATQVAADPASVVYDARSAMQWFRTLSGGSWSHEVLSSEPASKETLKSPGDSTFQVIAAGSTVMETWMVNTPFQMTVMYHMDGPETLYYDHYCSARNVPHLKFIKSSKPGQLVFRFDGGTNLNPKADNHVHDITYEPIDKNTFKLITTSYADGKPQVIYAIAKRQAAAVTAAADPSKQGTSYDAASGGGW